MDKTLAFIRAELLRRDEYWKEKLMRVREKGDDLGSNVTNQNADDYERGCGDGRLSMKDDFLALIDEEIKNLSDEQR